MCKLAIFIYVACKTEVIVLIVSVSLHKSFAEATSTSEQIKIFDALSGRNEFFLFRLFVLSLNTAER